MQRGRLPLALALATLGSQAAWADLTARYQFEIKVGPALPASAADVVKQQITGMLASDIVTRVKGDKCASSFGPLKSIVDSGKSEITIFDPAAKLFATVPEATYVEEILAQQQVSEAARQAAQSLFRTMKIEAQTVRTGEVASIQGIRAEENLIVVTMQPPGASIGIRLEIHQWLAATEELARVPALNELANCSSGLGSGADPSWMIEKILGPSATVNGLDDAVKGFVTARGRVTLKIHAEVLMPWLGANPNAPLMDVTFNLAELSPDPIPDAVFQVPEGYKAAPLEELLKTLTKTAQGLSPQSVAAAAAAPVIEDFTGSIVRAGNGVSNPVAISNPSPQYTEAARRAKIEGSVMLSLVIDATGVTRNIKVIQSLDPGLDEEAIAAVRQWRFKPGQKDGNPVAVLGQMQVTFKLLDKPAQQ